MTHTTRHTFGWTMALSLALSAAAFICAAAAPIAVSPNALAERGKRCWDDVRVLADDSMEGRRAGSPGHRRAAEYVAEQFRRAGLQPGGDGGFLQPVKLQSRELVEAQSRLALQRDQQTRELKLFDDAIFSLRGHYASKLD